MGLVLWIAIYVKYLADLFAYIDDNFLFDLNENVLWYSPYNCYYPEKKTKLLLLWDEIGLPNEKPKQEYGPGLHIIGFWVDPNLMHVTMDNEDQGNLLKHVRGFIPTAPGGTRSKNSKSLQGKSIGLSMFSLYSSLLYLMYTTR
jgi:hypothetical protein